VSWLGGRIRTPIPWSRERFPRLRSRRFVCFWALLFATSSVGFLPFPCALMQRVSLCLTPDRPPPVTVTARSAEPDGPPQSQRLVEQTRPQHAVAQPLEDGAVVHISNRVRRTDDPQYPYERELRQTPTERDTKRIPSGGLGTVRIKPTAFDEHPPTPHWRQRASTRFVISFEEGGFSARPSVCSISWMKAATICGESCCRARLISVVQRRTTRLPGAVIASTPGDACRMMGIVNEHDPGEVGLNVDSETGEGVGQKPPRGIAEVGQEGSAARPGEPFPGSVQRLPSCPASNRIWNMKPTPHRRTGKLAADGRRLVSR
jgi:hypothetical protein